MDGVDKGRWEGLVVWVRPHRLRDNLLYIVAQECEVVLDALLAQKAVTV